MNKIYYLLNAFLLLFATQSWAQTAIIGTGGTSTSAGYAYSVPIGGYYAALRYQTVYTAAELSAAGVPAYANLTGLGFAISEDYGGGDLAGYTIKLGHTSATNSAAHDASTTTIVKNAFNYNPTDTSITSFDTIAFDANFQWDGVSNILVDICTDGANSYTSPYGGVLTDAVSSGSRYYRSDYTTACDQTTNSVNSNRPQILFTYTPGAAPTCLPPTSLLIDTFGFNSVSFSWTTGGASSWIVEYGLAGFVQGTGTVITVNSSADTVLSGLTANTNYDIYVRDYCGGTDTSTSVGPLSVYTGYCEVSTSYTTDYIDSFSTSGANQNVGFSATSQTTGSYADETTQVIESYPNGSFDIFNSYIGGANGLNIWIDFNNDLDFDDTGEDVFSLVNTAGDKTGTILIPASTNIGTYRMRVRAAYGYAADPSSCGNENYGMTIDFTVNIVAPPSCVAPNTLTSNVLSSDSAVISWMPGASETEWIVEYNEVGSGTVMTFNSTSTTDTLLGLMSDTDYEFRVRSYCGVGDSSMWSSLSTFTTPISCFEPTSLTVNAFSLDTALVSWTTGGASSWIYEYGLAGFTPGNGIVVSDTFVVLNSLTAETEYDFYVRDVCGAGDTSAWAGPLSVYTGYCSGTMLYTSDYLDSISTSGANQNISYSTSTFPTNGYDNQTSQVVEVYENGSFDIFTSYYYGNNGVKVWVDWNNDLDFDDTGEEIFTFANADTDKTGTYTLPASVAAGTYRMRVRGIFYSSTFTPCSNQSYGSTVDFTLNVVSRPASDIDFLAYQMSDFNCGSDQTLIEVTLTNNGTSTQYNIPFTMNVSGDFTESYTINIDSIESMDTVSLVIDTLNTSTGGVANFEGYSSLMNDGNLSNDTLGASYTYNAVYSNPTFTDNVYATCEGDSVQIVALTGASEFFWFDDMNYTNLVYEGDSLNYNFNIDTTFYVATSDYFSTVYTLVLVDTYGDGWNGGALSITADGVAVTGSPFTILSSSTDTFSFRVDHNQAIEVTYTSGLYAYENEFYLYDQNNVLLVEDDGDSYNYVSPTTGVIYTGVAEGSVCYSDITMLEVNVNPKYDYVTSLTVCDEFTYGGNTVTASGVYVDSLTTVNGCDSVVTYELIVNNSSAQTQTLSACTNDTIIVGVNMYYATGVYVDTLSSVSGCDSVITTDLTVNTPELGTITGLTPEICEDAGVITVNLSPLGGTLSGDGIIGSSFDPSDAGLGIHTITYSFVDSNLCSSFVSADVEVIECTGIKEIKGIEAIAIYPNPFVSTLNIVFDDVKSGELNIAIYDVNGKRIFAQAFLTQKGINDIELNIPEGVSSGVHYIQIERNGESYTHSLLKK